GKGPVRQGGLRRRENPDQPEIRAQRRPQGARGARGPRHHRHVDPGAVTADGGKPIEAAPAEGAWGRWATLGLAILALLAGQMAALTALTWWYGAGIVHLPDFSGDGVAVALII